VIAGTYRVEEVVAEGGFGVVYKAHHKGFRATVALKCLKIPVELGAQYRSQFLEQFRSEAEVLFRLSALLPNIVRPLHVDAFQTRDGRFVPFMALEWLDGWTLDAVIAQRAEQQRPPIALKKLTRLLTPVARALEQAHNMPGPAGTLSIVHRDMKPENLFVALVGGEQLVKILDFGISKVKSAAGQLAGRESQTMTDLVSFSPAYGAPEQWLPKRYGQTGPWTDVWGMALTMVETIKGEEVVVGDQAAMLGTIIDPDRRPTPRNEGVKVSDEVEAIFRKALAVDPRDRYQSMNAFWDELLSALDLDMLGNPKRVARSDPRAEGSTTGRQEQLEAALSPRLSHISGLRPAVTADPLRLPQKEEGRKRQESVSDSILPAAGLEAPIGQRSAADPKAPVGRVGMASGEHPLGTAALEIPKAPLSPQFPASEARRRAPSYADTELMSAGPSAPRPVAVSRVARTELEALAPARHAVSSRGGGGSAIATPRPLPHAARAYPIVRSQPSLLRQLLPALALLSLAVALTLLDRAYAVTTGSTLSFGPLRASWLCMACFAGAVFLGVSSVRRSLD
jgi:serine/threonine protein kinase